MKALKSPTLTPAERRRAEYVARALALCGEINAACGSEVWSRKFLDDYINDRWQVRYGLDSMTFMTFPALLDELSQKLERVKSRRRRAAN